MVRERVHQCPYWAQPDDLYGPLPKHVSCLWKFSRGLVLSNMVSQKHPLTRFYYRSNAAVRMARFDQLKYYPFVCHPLSMFRAYYDIYRMFLFILVIIMLPLDATFKLTKSTIFLNVLCLMDILVTFKTGYIKRREIIMDPRKICVHYLKTYFFIDLLSSFCDMAWNKLNLLCFLKILRIETVRELMSHTGKLFKIPSAYVLAMQFLLRVFLIFHWFACLFYAIPNFKNNVLGFKNPDSWLIKAELVDTNATSNWIYMKLLFHSACHLLTVSDGLVSPQTAEDKIQATLTWIAGFMYKGYIFVSLFNIYSDSLAAQTDYLETICQVKDYMQHKQLPLPMQKRMICYYERRFEKKYFDEEQITSTLSSKLTKEINKYSCQRTIESVSIFKQLPRNIIDDVINVLQPEVFLPNDVIIRGGGYGDAMYFLAHGTVTVMTSTGKEICHLQDGAYFGEISLVLKDNKRIASVIAIEFCECFRLDRKDFKKSFKRRSDLFKVLETTANERANHTQLIEELHKKQLLEDIMKAELAEKLKSENL